MNFNRRSFLNALSAIPFLGGLAPKTNTTSIPLPEEIPWMWVENEKGEQAPVNMMDVSAPSPEEYPYAYSRFPNELYTRCHSRRKDGGYGEKDLFFAGGSTFNESLTLAIATGANGHKPRRLYDAIVIAGVACERCMNILAFDYGLKWGYSADSEDARKSRTSCELCRNLELEKP